MLTLLVATLTAGPCLPQQPTRIDLAADTRRQVVLDREADQYLGHVTTVLLEDGKTMIAVYPKGHGRGGIVMKRSGDGGRTWGERLPTPESWATSKEVPTLHRVVDTQGRKRLIMWSGLHPARLAVSEDDGATWGELQPAGDWGGIVVMGDVIALKEKGRYLAMFHDDGRFLKGAGQATGTFQLLATESRDGGLSWSDPRVLWSGKDIHLCEPGMVRSPAGDQIAVLLRENARRRQAHVMFSTDEGSSWTDPVELHPMLTGDRHTCRYTPDGRLVIVFRDRTLRRTSKPGGDLDKLGEGSLTEGDFVAWVGTYDDLLEGRKGQYRVRLLDNKKDWDCGYPGLEVLPDGTLVATTYGHWTAGEQPYIVSARFTLPELDAMAKERGK